MSTTTWLIIGGVIFCSPFAAIGVWMWRTRDSVTPGAHRSEARSFRDEGTPRPALALPYQQPGSLHGDQLAATYGRPWLARDMMTVPAVRYERPTKTDRLDVLVGAFVPPKDLPGALRSGEPVKAGKLPGGMTAAAGAEALGRHPAGESLGLGGTTWVLQLMLAPLDRLAETGQRSLESYARRVLEAS